MGLDRYNQFERVYNEGVMLMTEQELQKQQYDLEVQRADAGARPERARYHAGALDVENLDAGQEFEELPTTYIIFITENDIWGGGQALYPIDRINAATGLPFEDRQHIL